MVILNIISMAMMAMFVTETMMWLVPTLITEFKNMED